MTFLQFALEIGVFSVGILFGALLIAIFAINDRPATLDELADIAANAQDAELLDYLDKSECSLFFNPTLSAWGLLDGQNSLIATASNVRNTLARAVDSDARAVHIIGQPEVPAEVQHIRV